MKTPLAAAIVLWAGAASAGCPLPLASFDFTVHPDGRAIELRDRHAQDPAAVQCVLRLDRCTVRPDVAEVEWTYTRTRPASLSERTQMVEITQVTLRYQNGGTEVCPVAASYAPGAHPELSPSRLPPSPLNEEMRKFFQDWKTDPPQPAAPAKP